MNPVHQTQSGSDELGPDIFAECAELSLLVFFLLFIIVSARETIGVCIVELPRDLPTEKIAKIKSVSEAGILLRCGASGTAG